jgi:metallophosphoesterase superfamily enzyme
MKTKVTTDYHVAVKRVGGTTPLSQENLRQYIRAALAHQLDDNDHLIAGDLFSDFTVDTYELVETYKIFSAWLASYGKKLALIRGNHDFSIRGMAVSSFDLLCTILTEQFPQQVTIASEVIRWKQFILVPHLPNNEILTSEISKLSSVTGSVVVFHANVNNFFAAEAQHSLNVTIEQVEDLVSRNNLVIFGHEHQYRSLVNGRCLVLGNTVPSSIADVLGSPFKYSATVTGTDYELKTTWKAEDAYIEIDWRDIATANLAGLQFIRVTGEASAAESAEVIKVVSTLRQSSSAFVIANAVKIEGYDMTLTTESVESIAAFDMVGAIMESLNEKEQEVVKGLLP